MQAPTGSVDIVSTYVQGSETAKQSCAARVANVMSECWIAVDRLLMRTPDLERFHGY